MSTGTAVLIFVALGFVVVLTGGLARDGEPVQLPDPMDRPQVPQPAAAK